MTKRINIPKQIYYKSKFFVTDNITFLDSELTNLKDSSNPLVDDAKFFIYKNVCENIKIQDVCSYLDVSEAYFIRLFKKVTNTTPHSFIMNVKALKAKELLKKGVEISQVAQLVGFSDQSHLNRVFKKHFSTTPCEYKMLFN